MGVIVGAVLLTIFIAGALFSVLFLTSVQVFGDDASNDIDEITVTSSTDTNTVSQTQSALDSTVSVYSTANGEVSQGSGFLYRDDYIITNEHVVKDDSDIEVQFREGEWRTATVVGTDVDSDIAVLEVAGEKPEYTSSLTLSSDDPPQRGSKVIAVGAPVGLDGTVTTGIVSGTERTGPIESESYRIPDMIQTDAALNPGNSGGPLISSETGEVVGVNQALAGQNIGFAISSRLTKRVADSLIETGNHTHPRVGVTAVEVSPFDGQTQQERTSGVLVLSVEEGGPADGVLVPDSSDTQGDIIVSIDGTDVQRVENITSHIMVNNSPGDTVTFEVYRDGNIEEVEVELGARE